MTFLVASNEVQFWSKPCCQCRKSVTFSIHGIFFEKWRLLWKCVTDASKQTYPVNPPYSFLQTQKSWMNKNSHFALRISILNIKQTIDILKLDCRFEIYLVFFEITFRFCLRFCSSVLFEIAFIIQVFATLNQNCEMQKIKRKILQRWLFK